MYTISISVVDVVLIVVMWLAALMQLAVVRDPLIVESDTSAASRRVLAIGLAAMATRFMFVLFGDGDFKVPFEARVGLGLIAFGALGLAIERLWLRPIRRQRRKEDRPEDEPRIQEWRRRGARSEDQ